MIWSKLSLLALLASLCESDSSSDSYLVYAIEKRESFDFRVVDLDFNNSKKVTSLKKPNTDLANMFLSRDKHGLILYWSFKNSSVIGRYQFSNKIKESKEFSEDNTVFLGVGYNEELYLYSPNSQSISVFEYDRANKPLKTSELQISNTDLDCVDIDPKNREQIFYAECADNKYTGRVYDVSDKAILEDYEQNLPQCFDLWRITPNGERAYAFKGKVVYLSPYEGSPFTEHYTADDDIVGFAVGNNEFFYSNKIRNGTSKILKATPHEKGHLTSELQVEGAIKLLALYTPPKRYLIFAAENNSLLEFVKTDLDFNKPTTLCSLKTNGMVLDKMHLGYNKDGHVLYWSFKDSKFFGRLGITDSQYKNISLKEEYGTFLGAGNNDNLYFYSSSNGTFTVYNFQAEEKQFEVQIHAKNGMHCADIDPRNRNQVFFAECTEDANTGKVFDVNEQKVLENYSQTLPVCFDTWGITPNGKKAYAAKEGNIYMSPKEGAPFGEYTWVDGSIQTFAVGNNELFYTTNLTGKQIFKITSINEAGEHFISELDAHGNVKALVLHED